MWNAEIGRAKQGYESTEQQSSDFTATGWRASSTATRDQESLSSLGTRRLWRNNRTGHGIDVRILFISVSCKFPAASGSHPS